MLIAFIERQARSACDRHAGLFRHRACISSVGESGNWRSSIPGLRWDEFEIRGRTKVNRFFRNICALLKGLAIRQGGQDLVEYALVVALIAFAATAGMRKVAAGVSSAYSNASSQLVSSV